MSVITSPLDLAKWPITAQSWPAVCIRLGALAVSLCLFASTAIPVHSQTNKTDSLPEKTTMNIERTPFGNTSEGFAVDLFTLTNAEGNSIKLTNFGAILVSVEVPDRDGKLANINLGFESLSDYLGQHPYFGSTVGRYANRIAKGKFSIDGQEYTLAVNNGPNHLHGGLVGFSKQVWQAEEISTADSVGVRFKMTSPDGQEGYPGKLDVVAVYTWNNANELSYTFEATTDAATVLNLTQHAYWNLAGSGSGDVLKQVVQLNCDHYTAVDDTLIPTGEIASVEGTPLDFRQPHPLGARIAQLPSTKGYDHCFVINGPAGTLRHCATAYDPGSGRSMEMLTTQTGVQLYTANHLGAPWGQHGAFCLETQHFPDSPNRPEFPTTRLNPGEKYSETTVHRFSVK